MYQNFVGIDIAKNSFVVSSHGHKKVDEYSNDEEGFCLFYQEYKSILEKALVVLETTGGHEMSVIRFLQKKQIAVHRANAAKVKFFIRSFGKLGKSDAIDAKALAHYGADRHQNLEVFVESPNKKLLKLVQRRSDIKRMMVQEKNRMQSPEQEELRESYKATIEFFQKQIKVIDDEVKEITSKDKLLMQKKETLKTIEGIGDTIAIYLLAILPELGTINRKKIASLAGVAPHPNESGEKAGYRYTRGGRADIKSILFMAAMSASRSNSRLGDFYQRLINAGKKKMVAMTALMRKIVVIANARISELIAESITE